MSIVKNTLEKIPFIGRKLIDLIWGFKKKFKHVDDSGKYWENIYKTGGNSGEGSYNRLSLFKAEILNEFLTQNEISKAIEFGSGDGNQLALIKYPSYLGLDVSPTAVELCRKKFKPDSSKQFMIYDSDVIKQKNLKADLTLSLDVIYHLLEDSVFNQYMNDLFDCSNKFVIIYSSNYNSEIDHHERDRKFSDWIENNKPEWKLIKLVENRYKYNKSDPVNTSKADFFFYSK